jgi:transposase-like protein
MVDSPHDSNPNGADRDAAQTLNRHRYTPAEWRIVSTCPRCFEQGFVSPWRRILTGRPNRRFRCFNCGKRWRIFSGRQRRRL